MVGVLWAWIRDGSVLEDVEKPRVQLFFRWRGIRVAFLKGETAEPTNTLICCCISWMERPPSCEQVGTPVGFTVRFSGRSTEHIKTTVGLSYRSCSSSWQRNPSRTARFGLGTPGSVPVRSPTLQGWCRNPRCRYRMADSLLQEVLAVVHCRRFTLEPGLRPDATGTPRGSRGKTIKFKGTRGRY